MTKHSWEKAKSKSLSIHDTWICHRCGMMVDTTPGQNPIWGVRSAVQSRLNNEGVKDYVVSWSEDCDEALVGSIQHS